MLSWYSNRLANQPLVTRGLTSAILFGLGDSLAQHGAERRPFNRHDYARTSRMIIYGGLIFGPATAQWYAFLQKSINLQGQYITAIARVLADQALLAPTNLACFLTCMSLMEGSSPASRLQSTYLSTLQRTWTVWPLVQTLNFLYVPAHFRPLAVNCVSICWNCYLSEVANNRAWQD